MSEIKNVGWTLMTLKTSKCNHLTPVHFNPLTADPVKALHFAVLV